LRMERTSAGVPTPVPSVLSTEGSRDMFAAAERLDLEGIVAKRKADARHRVVQDQERTYMRGEGRWELFQKRA
jgi:hypothetical protein